VPPDMMLPWRSFSCGVRSRSVATRAAPSMVAIQQTQNTIMTHAPRVRGQRSLAFLSTRFRRFILPIHCVRGGEPSSKL
jgi:hypothetical protein